MAASAASIIVSGGEHAVGEEYPTLAEFFPAYLAAHEDPLNRLLHVFGTTLVVVLIALRPTLLYCCLVSGAVAYTASVSTKRLAVRPAIELVALVVPGLTMALAMKHSPRFLLLLPLAGYGCAWIGHFVFQRNMPAAFAHPTYSLLSDLRMWAEVVAGTRSLDERIAVA